MQHIIQTIAGTFIVPDHKEAELVSWLQQHAIKSGSVREQVNDSDYKGQQLINETYQGEF